MFTKSLQLDLRGQFLEDRDKLPAVKATKDFQYLAGTAIIIPA